MLPRHINFVLLSATVLLNAFMCVLLENISSFEALLCLPCTLSLAMDFLITR